MLFKLTKRPYDEALLRFLFIDEHLVDIGDDLVDYEVHYKPRLFAACNAVNRYVNICRMMSLQIRSTYTEVTTSSCEHHC